MNTLLGNLDVFYKEQPNKTALMYSSSGEKMTYGELEEYSGRVYRYLKKHYIGKEKIVLINLPRGIKILACMIGVWRAGAACIMCESSMAAERINYIAEDSKAFIINREILEEIEGCKTLAGREKVDPHDLAYLVYTSGSTGKPKGVLHEFGAINQELMAQKYDGQQISRKEDILALNSPLNFIAAIDHTVNILGMGGTVLLMDTADVKDPERRIRVYAENKVTSTFMTPSLYKTCPYLNPEMSWIILGGEPCTGIYNDKVTLYNAYNMSEAGRVMCFLRIDKPYELTPVGTNQGNEEILLLREDGSRADTDEIAELCFANPYIRGYMNLPEKTAEVFKDGIYHSGDLASRTADGKIVLHGRSDDMIKINGNRIEPAEIEICAKALLPVKNVAVKGFVTKKGSFVVLYYTDDVTIDPKQARELLSKKLSSYMIPSFFVKLPEIPLLPSGKIDKKKLKQPDISEYRKEYVKPESALQKKLCALFEEVLNEDKVGIDDDFFELGGDSVRAMDVLNRAKEQTLNVNDIYHGRTARRIAEILEAKTSEESDDVLEERAKREGVPLALFETYLLDYQLYAPFSTLCNMPLMWRMNVEDVDTDRLVGAIEALIENHPAFKSALKFNDKMQLVKYYDEKLAPKVFVENVTEKEFGNIRPTLIHPFHTYEAPCRFRVFKTEKSVYLFMDFNHVFNDGESLHVIERDLSSAYHGKKLKKDYYYLISKQMYDRENGVEAKEAAEYNNARYGGVDWVRNVPPNYEARGNHAGILALPVGVDRKKVDAFLREKNISLNVLNLTVGLLAMREKEKCNDIMLSWIYNGRETLKHKNCVGFLIKELPVAVSFDKIKSLDELIASVKEQTIKGMEMSADPYILRTVSIAEVEMFRIRNQGDLRQSTLIDGIPFETLFTPDTRQAAFGMDLQIMENPDGSLESWFVFNDHMIEHYQAVQLSQLYFKYYEQVISGEFIL